MSNLDARAVCPANIWWGQVVDDTSWKQNTLQTKWMGTDKIPGWGDRYQVRILGRDTENKDVPDDQLEWAEVAYPVTAGSGHKGSYQTSNLRKGAFVFGFYKDATRMSEPIILGCLANNDQTKLSQSIPLKGFVPFSGYITERVSYNDIAGESSPEPASGKDPREGATSNTALETSVSDQAQLKHGKQEIPLGVSTDCDKVQLGAIQIEIKKFIQDIQNFKNKINSWRDTILYGKIISEEGNTYSLEEYIAYKIENVSKFITGKLKTIVTEIEAYVERKIDGALKDTYDFLPPDYRATAKQPVENARDLLACLFRKIINNLFRIVSQILKTIAERYINAPLCAIENIVASFLGKLTGLINSAVQAILGPLQAILGIVDIVGDIINFVSDLLSFLLCEEKPKCPEVTAWSPWDGPTQFATIGPFGGITGIVDKVKDYAKDVQQSVDPDNFDFDFDFSDIFQDTCNVGPIFCGPPRVEFFGGGGSGAAGNAIVNAAGNILGIDITSFGSGYTSQPVISFVDACGGGQSASGRAVIGSIPDGGAGISTTTIGVTKVIMVDPGFGYSSATNGDLGGDGRVWAKRNQTTVKRKDGRYDRPYNPGETIEVDVDDEVQTNGKKEKIKVKKVITAPEVKPDSLPRSIPKEEKYSATLELDFIAILESGINYNPKEDKIKITPSRGSLLSFETDSFGTVTKVNVLKRGVGFTEMPKVEIETKSGYNAKLRAVFRVNRDVANISKDKLISIVDCVGKF